MWTARRSPSRRWIAWPLIAGGHAIVVLLIFAGDRTERPRRVEREDPLVVRLVRPREPVAVPAPALPAAASRAAGRPSAPRTESRDDAPSTAIHVPPPARDWDAAASRVARDAVAARRRGFGIPESAPAPAKPREFGWDKSVTERTRQGPLGLEIRLSENCSIVLMPLPIGGCAIGKRPANGALFEDMRSPDRPRSSVPDVPHSTGPHD
jgi:hypothetical protein